MNLADIPWTELSVGIPLLGALVVSFYRKPQHAFYLSVGFSTATLVCALLAWVAFPGDGSEAVSMLESRLMFSIDDLSAPLLSMVAFAYCLTIVTTTWTKMGRFSFTASLLSEALQLAVFACKEPWLLIALMAAGTVPPYIVLRTRQKPTRVYVLHMLLFVGLLVSGWAFVDPNPTPGSTSDWATLLILAAVLVRCGTIPAHCWVIDWFENASFGNALLYVIPLTGVYAAVRLVLPIAPDWVLQGIGMVSLVTAVYAAAMATIQHEVRRFFAFIFLSHASLVLVGLELHTPISLTGALCLWVSVTFSVGGLGLTMRALEARFGNLSLTSFRGLYDHSPTLAICFMITGLASVGFPGTLGFIATELLVDGAIEANLFVGLAVVIAAAFNSIAIVRVYFLLFTGARHTSTISLEMNLRERLAVLTLAALILLGGLFPQPGVFSRFRAAEAILHDRHAHGIPDADEPPTELFQ